MQNLLFTGLCFTLLFVFTTAKFIDCGASKGGGKVISVKVNNDTGSGPFFKLKRGTNALFEVQFSAGFDTKTLKSVCHGIIAGIPIPFPLPQTDGCKGSGLQCPIRKGKPYTFKTVIPVSKAYPKVKVVVKWEEKGDTSKDEFCLEVPAEIVD